MANWKAIAIFLLIVLILETSLIGYAYYEGGKERDLQQKEINREIKCANEVCFYANSSGYKYYANEHLCQCYDNGEVIIQEVLE